MLCLLNESVGSTVSSLPWITFVLGQRLRGAQISALPMFVLPPMTYKKGITHPS